jgi:haloalkane dehalogenase
VLPGGIQRRLSDEEMDHYRAPFVNPGEDRRPTLSWPRNLPIDGQPADVASVVNDYSGWLAESDVPKLFVNAEPGAVVHGRIRELIRSWPNLTETTVSRSAFRPGRQSRRDRYRRRGVRADKCCHVACQCCQSLQSVASHLS